MILRAFSRQRFAASSSCTTKCAFARPAEKAGLLRIPAHS